MHASTSYLASLHRLFAVPQPIPIRETAGAPVPAQARIHVSLDRLATLAATGGAPARLERKQAALLAYVHLAGPTARSRLAGLLWPGATASGGRANLRQCMARLRRMAPGVLAEIDDTVALGPTVRVDEPRDTAAELLDGYDYADCDDFARWLQGRVDAERAGRQARLAAALRDAVGRGDLAEAQARADALLALDGESEEAFRALMEVALLRGDFAAAVRTWDRCRDMLRQLYGVAPSHATQALGAAILAAAPPTWRAAAVASAIGHPAPAEAGPGNLGLAPPVLYGRTDELAAVLSMLRSRRLVTLLGIGGVGKTSLALAAAHAERRRWRAGVWFVDLAPVTDPEHVAGAIAGALGVSLGGHRPPLDELVSALGSSEVLLVIDNAEHLWEAVSAVASALLDGTTHLRLLVTSRQALRLPQEHRFPLAGLAAPTDPDLSDLRQLGALTLFAARVTALLPHFRLSPENAPAVADVCRRLDGLPLAIELAAARVPVLGLDALRDRLHRSLRVLGSRATISTPRHQTLRATFDWTHDLLSPGERKLLRRLAVFVGGFSLALAEDVAAAGADGPDAAAPGSGREPAGMLDDLGALIEKSLVVVGETDPPRYRLLEVTRAYALEKLVEAGEFDRISKRHAHAVWRLFAGAEADLNEKTRGALSRGRFLHRLAPELDNLRAARAWSAASADERLLSVGLAAASTEALRLLGRSTEALQALLSQRERLDETMPSDTLELYWTGLCALGTHGRMSRAEMLDVIDRGERIYRQAGSARRIHVGLYRKGFALLHLGDVDAAQQAVSEMGSLEDSFLAGQGGGAAPQPAGGRRRGPRPVRGVDRGVPERSGAARVRAGRKRCRAERAQQPLHVAPRCRTGRGSPVDRRRRARPGRQPGRPEHQPAGGHGGPDVPRPARRSPRHRAAGDDRLAQRRHAAAHAQRVRLARLARGPPGRRDQAGRGGEHAGRPDGPREHARLRPGAQEPGTRLVRRCRVGRRHVALADGRRAPGPGRDRCPVHGRATRSRATPALTALVRPMWRPRGRPLAAA